MPNNMIRPWEDIESYFADLVEAGLPFYSTLTLIKEIRKSHYSTSLFAWTSMQDLCIVQTPVVIYPAHGPYLRISRLENDRLEFRYIDTAVEDRQWHRVVGGAEGFARLTRFIDQLHWF